MLMLTQTDWQELYENTEWTCVEDIPLSDCGEGICPMLTLLGTGQTRVVELNHGLAIFINTWDVRHSHRCQFPER
jgi:hypothetical protein